MTGYQGESLEKGQKTRFEIMKRTIKDSVFMNLFQDRSYLIQLYHALHPEDTETTADELRDITIRNVLKEYLESREKEVMDIMMLLDDEEEITRMYIESEIEEGIEKGMQKGIQETQIETARRMLEDGALSLEKIAQFSNLLIETVEQLAEKQI